METIGNDLPPVVGQHRRSDQRNPPRATAPKRMWTPSTRGEYTKVSKRGRGAGMSGTADGPFPPGAYARKVLAWLRSASGR